MTEENNLFGDDELEETIPTKPVDVNDTKKIKEELKDYADSRMSSSIIGESHTRQTFLISDETIEKLQNLTAHFEATNGLDSELTKGMSKEEINKGRVLSKGVKSKIVNYAIKKFLDEYEQEENAPIPNTEHKKFKTGSKSATYHNAYRFTQDGVTYGITQDPRGREIHFMSTDSGNTLEEINEWFDAIEDQSKREGRPRKK